MTMTEKSEMSFDELMKSVGGRPDNLDRSFEELVASATTEDGAIDLAALDDAPAVGYNGGVKCDVTSGPCSCGAWH